MNNIAIYGAGALGNYLYKKIQEQGYENMVDCFIDNNSDYYKTIHGKMVLSEDLFFLSGMNDEIIICIKNRLEAQERIISLLNKGYKKIRLVHCQADVAKLQLIENKEFNNNVKSYKDCKPILPYLEFQIADECNMKCRNCFHYSNLVKASKHLDINSFKRAFVGLQDKFSNINTIRILGGEPLLNPELPEYIRYVREFFPLSMIHVVTNGLLIPNISDELIYAMKMYGDQFTISNYLPVRDNLSEIISILEKNSIKYEITKPIEFFYLRTTRGESNYNDAFKVCCSRNCHFLRNEKLYLCTHVPMLFENKDYFKLDVSQDEFDQYGMDIYDSTISGWDILLKWEQPMDFCRFCSVKKEFRPWSNGKIQSDDWIV